MLPLLASVAVAAPPVFVDAAMFTRCSRHDPDRIVFGADAVPPLQFALTGLAAHGALRSRPALLVPEGEEGEVVVGRGDRVGVRLAVRPVLDGDALRLDVATEFAGQAAEWRVSVASGGAAVLRAPGGSAACRGGLDPWVVVVLMPQVFEDEDAIRTTREASRARWLAWAGERSTRQQLRDLPVVLEAHEATAALL